MRIKLYMFMVFLLGSYLQAYSAEPPPYGEDSTADNGNTSNCQELERIKAESQRGRLQTAEKTRIDWTQNEVEQTTKENALAQKRAFDAQTREAQKKAQTDERKERARRETTERKAAEQRIYEKDTEEYPQKIARYYAQQDILLSIAKEIAIAVSEMKERHPRFAFKAGLELFTTLRSRGLKMGESDTSQENMRQFHQEMVQRIFELQQKKLELQPSTDEGVLSERLHCWYRDYNRVNFQNCAHEKAYLLLKAYYTDETYSTGKEGQCALGLLQGVLFRCGIGVKQNALGGQSSLPAWKIYPIAPFWGFATGSYTINQRSDQSVHDIDTDLCGMCCSFGPASSTTTSCLVGPHIACDSASCGIPCAYGLCAEGDASTQIQAYDMSEVLMNLDLGEPRIPVAPASSKY